MVVGLSENQCLLTSARTGEGIDTLRASIDALVEAVRPR
jgi:selenocysteine-specific translation elongation factor